MSFNKSNNKSGMETGSFSFNLKDVEGPVSKSLGMTKEEFRRGIDAEVASRPSPIAISTTNKSVYISRIEGRFDERDVIRIIESARVGRVQYVDFTAVKDNSPDAGLNPAFKFYSAFVMMSEWNLSALSDMTERGQIKVWIDSSRTTYFMLRPGKEGSEIPRSKVNTHQLAAYTAELYNRLDAMTKEQSAVIAAQNKKIEDQHATIADLICKMDTMMEVVASSATAVAFMDGFLASKFPRPDETIASNAYIAEYNARALEEHNAKKDSLMYMTKAEMDVYYSQKFMTDAELIETYVVDA